MPRNRVLSFMSQWGSDPRPTSSTPPPRAASRTPVDDNKPLPPLDTSASADILRAPTPRSPRAMSRARADSRQGTRPLSMIQTYQAPQVDVNDTPPELQPIFGLLNSHGNKLYQEGYFLKLHDLDSRGRPSADRTWVECFAQLVGTVLSLWDAAALDGAGVDGEVVPTFINLSDAALKMIESLPMSGAHGGRLTNVLSISTAANNRYLLHFNSLNSLTQWTAGIRLAMFEHATLQEAYTGSLIAGKGRYLNNIKVIMERTRFPTEDWARVRFGAGTPWRRLWFVITPPDEKDFQKSQKMQKKGTSYLRSELPRGDIKFYESRKVNKKSKPVATINDVYACYAIYPQSKPLIDQSTLVKMEGLVTIHNAPETTAEGFVFIMPEVHAAVTGFEMMLRWLFPVWDTFNIYGRPARLIADTLDQRGLMFAMPNNRRYGYLDTLDVSALIHEKGSQAWSERQWRKQLKKLTAERMNAQLEDMPGQPMHRRVGSGPRNSPVRQGVRFGAGDETASTPHSRSASPSQQQLLSAPLSPHKRSASEAGYKKYQADTPSRLSRETATEQDYPPEPPRHGDGAGRPGMMERIESGIATPTLASMESGLHPTTDPLKVPPEPVSTPPAMTHAPSSRPANSPAVAPELRRAHSAVDAATLFQMQEASSQEPAADDQYRQLASQMVATPHDADRSNLRNANTDHSQGSAHVLPAVMIHPADNSPALSSMVSSALRPESGESYQTYSRQSHPLPPPPIEEAPEMGLSGAQAGPVIIGQIDRPPLSGPTKSGSSISRKPIARKAVQSPPSVALSTPSEHGSLRGAYIDNDALERVLSDENRLSSMGSSVTPDYASTASRSSAGKKSVERPRMGQLKTVGDANVQPGYNGAEIPAVDFGPTYRHDPTSRPTTTATAGSHDRMRSSSRDRLATYQSANPRVSPNEHNRLSYFGLNEQQNGSRAIPGERHRQSNFAGADQIAGADYAPPVNRQSVVLSPEQWVQHRAAMANQPQLPPKGISAHTRNNSSVSTVKQSRKLTKTPPPFGRNSSIDHRRKESNTPPSRPSSRDANSYLSQAPSNSLHASEQRQRENASPGLRNGQADVTIRARQQEQAQAQSQPQAQYGKPRQQQQQQGMSAQQQFQHDLQAAKLAYASSTENLRAAQDSSYRGVSQTRRPVQQQQQQQPHQGQWDQRRYEQGGYQGQGYSR